jgi:hypothetical protein
VHQRLSVYLLGKLAPDDIRSFSYFPQHLGGPRISVGRPGFNELLPALDENGRLGAFHAAADQPVPSSPCCVMVSCAV